MRAMAKPQNPVHNRAGRKSRIRRSALNDPSQPYLFLEEAAAQPTCYAGLPKLNGGIADSAFSDNKLRPIHRWVPWIAGFSAEFVRDVFGRYLPKDSPDRFTVLDPFCGVGTTLVEGLLHGNKVIGFDINPYAAMAARAKIEAAAIAPSRFHTYIEQFEAYMGKQAPGNGLACRPLHFKSRIPFFGRQVEKKILKALQFI